ncbi:MAG: acetyl-CoA carboxylase, biotin carboxyl carrier protein [Alphaproteobacteria bacterium]|nr:acetyl-CoA carboxylase, biotin carboxyl carrier protein [Alphaproteobacteria bacterium]
MFKKKKDVNSLVNELVALLNQHNLSEIEYERNGQRIKISNAKGGAIIAGGVMPSSPVAAAPAGNANTTSAPDYSNAFKSPMVGVVYMKPEPSAKEFVVEGQSVKKGDTLCLIEAMKTFNPVKSPKDGIIKKILVKDSETVEYEQPLFVIE